MTSASAGSSRKVGAKKREYRMAGSLAVNSAMR